ncbi:MAG: hypothetical protein RR712_04125 [Terrisporobacter sp.]|uniref:hypothetical protein n=1 Tax=Clostridium sp. TaxID=1506 RepID=UPI0030382DB6
MKQFLFKNRNSEKMDVKGFYCDVACYMICNGSCSTGCYGSCTIGCNNHCNGTSKVSS